MGLLCEAATEAKAARDCGSRGKPGISVSPAFIHSQAQLNEWLTVDFKKWCATPVKIGHIDPIRVQPHCIRIELKAEQSSIVSEGSSAISAHQRFMARHSSRVRAAAAGVQGRQERTSSLPSRHRSK